MAVTDTVAGTAVTFRQRWFGKVDGLSRRVIDDGQPYSTYQVGLDEVKVHGMPDSIIGERSSIMR